MIWISATIGILFLIFEKHLVSGSFGILIATAGLIFGIYLLIKGADYLVEGAVDIAKRAGVSNLFIGLSLVAFGTSAPELAVSLTASMKGYGGVAISNVVGSNVANILLCLGLTALLMKVSIDESTFKIEIPFLLIVSTSFVVMLLRYPNPSVDWNDGVVLLGFFVVFIHYLYKMAKSDMETIEKDKNVNVWKAVLMTILGLVGVSIGGEMTVSTVVDIAGKLGLSRSLFALTVVAVGTSLPEMLTSITAAKKGHHGVSVGNIVGSNVMNILLIIGLSSIIGKRLTVDVKMYYVDMSFLLGSALLLWIVSRKRTLGRAHGIAFLVLYTSFVFFIIERG